jgi:hypothetical protein
MDIKKSYYYFFYKFYKLGDMSFSIFSSDFVALVIIIWLEMIFVGSFVFYYRDFINPNLHIELMTAQVLIPIGIIVLINVYAFITNDTKWKTYFKEFNKFSVKQNDNGTLVVAGIVIIVIANFLVSVSLG